MDWNDEKWYKYISRTSKRIYKRRKICCLYCSGVKGRKIVKHGLSHMGAKRLYNKLVKTDNYDEVGFDDHKSWNQNNIRKVDELVTPMAVSNPAAYDALLNKQIAKDTKVKTAYNDKNHKMHGKAKSLVQRFLDKFKKKNGKKDDKPIKMLYQTNIFIRKCTMSVRVLVEN